MTVLDRTSRRMGLRDEQQNIQLAGELVAAADRESIEELAIGLSSTEKALRHDCLKVLYEVGKLEPSLIAGYAERFLELLKDKNNRMVWGAMIALSTVAELRASLLAAHLENILSTMKAGTVITNDAGIRVLAGMVAGEWTNAERVWPHILEHLRSCRPKDIPQRAESVMKAVAEEQREDMAALLEERRNELTDPQRIRVDRLLVKLRKEG